MTIKELKTILEQAPDEDAKVFIDGCDEQQNFGIGYNFDDNNDLDLYVIIK